MDLWLALDTLISLFYPWQVLSYSNKRTSYSTVQVLILGFILVFFFSLSHIIFFPLLIYLSLFSCFDIDLQFYLVPLFELFRPLIGVLSLQYANDEDAKKRRRLLDPFFSHSSIKNVFPVFIEVLTSIHLY